MVLEDSKPAIGTTATRPMHPGLRPCVLVVLMLVAPASTFGQSAVADSRPGVRDLLTAARTGDLTGLARALGAGVPVDAVDPNFQQTALIRAAMFGQAAAARALLRAGASVAATSSLQRSALHWAAIDGSPVVVRLLVGAGATVDAVDADGETPLGHAMGAGHVGATDILLAAGADASRAHRSVAFHLNLVLGNRVTGPRRDALRAVIGRGRGLEQDDGSGRTALLVTAAWAHQDGSADIARELLAAGARRDVRNPDGRTALDDVRARMVRETDPDYRTNLEHMVRVLTEGARR